jgi:hypothetical protein
MIDTLSRHLAALSESRRLMAMVLANNKNFVEFQKVDQRALMGPADPALAALRAALDDDPYYRAYCHLNYAIALLSPPSQQTVNSCATQVLALADQIVELTPAPAPTWDCPSRARCAASLAPADCAARRCAEDGKSDRSLATRAERLRYVLQDPPVDQSGDEVTISSIAAMQPRFSAVDPATIGASSLSQSLLRDEAKVSIVWRDQRAGTLPLAMLPKSGPTALVNRLSGG